MKLQSGAARLALDRSGVVGPDDVRAMSGGQMAPGPQARHAMDEQTMRAQPVRLSDQLARWLQAAIADGRYSPGARIPTEAALVALHGVSRSVVREAVHQLKSQGLVQSRQGSGVYVSASPPVALRFDPGVLHSMDGVLDVMELRRALEGEMAALAAERATRTQVRDIKRRLKAIDDAMTNGRDGVTEDMAFHHSIGAAAGNPQFVRMLGFIEHYLHDAMRVTKSNEARLDRFMQQVRQEHTNIVNAIEAGNARAARHAAVTHLRQGAARLVQGGIVSGERVHRRHGSLVRRASTAKAR